MSPQNGVIVLTMFWFLTSDQLFEYQLRYHKAKYFHQNMECSQSLITEGVV